MRVSVESTQPPATATARMSVATRTVPGFAASKGANPPDGRHGVPDAAKTTSVAERVSVSNPVQSKSS